jgi:protein TonB
MKTNKNIQPSVAITLDDIIFSNRNQAYGAYYLRKKYNIHLLYALLLIIFVLGTGITIPMIWEFIFPKGPEVPVNQLLPPTTFDPTKIIDVPLPPTPKTDPPREILKNTHFGVYIPVDSVTNNDTTRHTEIPIDNPNYGTNNDTFIVRIDTSIVPSIDKYFTGIGEPATFEGEGLEKFHDWVQKTINYPSEASSVGIEGKVTLSFTVNKQGNVCDANIIRGVHPSINKETVRVLLSSPKWQPAKQNGTPVKQRFYMQVKYQLQ